MKILVTGSTGFIGNNIIPILLLKGYEVIATSRDKEKAKSRAWYSSVTFKEFDIDKYKPETNYVDFFECPAGLIHIAWDGLPNFNSELHLTKNLPLHSFFISNLVKNGLKNITVTGTCLEYGLIEGELNEAMPSSPVTAYGKAKNELRLVIDELTQQYDFSFKWLRLFYVYGLGQYPSALYSQLHTAVTQQWKTFNMSNGDQERDYLSIEKMASIIVEAALQQKVNGIINCCSGKPIAVKQFVTDFFKLYNYQISLNLGYYTYPDYEPFSFWGNTQKLNRIIYD